MSNKTTLQSHNARIQELINTANSLPNAGSGGSGGGSVETCAVTITIFQSIMNITISNVMCTILEDGIIKGKNILHEDFQTVGNPSGGETFSKKITIQAVVGTNIYLYDGNMAMPVIEVSSNISLSTVDDYESIYSATINGGSTATITASFQQ